MAPTYCVSSAPVALTPTTPGGQLSGPGISGNTFTPAGSNGGGTITYSVTGLNGCSNSTSQTATVFSPVPLSLSNDGPLNCLKTTATLTVTPAGQGMYAFSASALSGGANTATVSQTGVYSVTLTSAGGCTSTASTTVTSDTALPNASFTGLALFYCSSSSPVALTPATPGGVFTGPGITGSTFAPASAGSGGTITYSVTATNGCVGTSAQSVTVNPTPTVNLSNNGPLVCGSVASVTLTASPAGAGTYAFSPGVSPVREPFGTECPVATRKRQNVSSRCHQSERQERVCAESAVKWQAPDPA